MNRFPTPAALVLALLLVPGAWLPGSLPTARAQSGGDAVVMKDGSPQRGTIVRTTPNEIVLEVRGEERKLDVADVDRIRFASEPAALRQAIDLIEGEQYEAALKDLSRLEASDLKRKVVAQEVEFLKAKCLALGGSDVTEAARATLTFVRSNEDSYRYYDALEMVGDLVMQMGRYDKAAEFYQLLGRAPWPDRRLRAAVLEATALQAQGPDRCDEAIKQYEAVIEANLNSAAASRYKQQARVGRAACLATQGQADQALADLQDVIANNSPQDVELFARAYNALGACYRQLDQPKEATLAYLHTDILYHHAHDAHAEALYYLGQLWQQLGKTDRSVAAQQLLKSRYAGSTWASR